MCKASKEELLNIAEEIAFAKALAANDKALRDRALKKLRKWFLSKASQTSKGIRFTEEGLMRIWKGLHYCVWMSDKPLIQEECVESVSNLIHCLDDPEDARKFLRCFFTSVSQSWMNLDGHRIDKYLMLIRRFLRQIFQYLYNRSWREDVVNSVGSDILQILEQAPLGLCLHICEVYLEELAKVGRGELEPRTVLLIIKPLADFMATSNDSRFLKYIRDYVFLQLLRQSDEGIKYAEKFEVWKQMGFPEGDIDVIQEASDTEEDLDEEEEMDVDMEDSEAMDPRAGNVDAYLPPINFDAKSIQDYLLLLTRNKDTSTKARKAISAIIKKYDIYLEGKYPLGIQRFEIPEKEDVEELIDTKAQELLEEEKSYAVERKNFKLKQKGRLPEGWEVTQAKEPESEEEDGEISNRGKWKIRMAKKRRNDASESLCSTMKRIKITKDDSLLEDALKEGSESEGLSDSMGSLALETVSLNSSEAKVISEGPVDPGSPGKSALKRKKKGATPANSYKRFRILFKSIKEYDEMMKKKAEEKKKKIAQAQKEWGLSEDWGGPSHEEEIVIPFTPNEKKADASTPIGKSTPVFKTPSSGKKVEFNLSENKEQDIKEYEKVLKESPQIPFNNDKKPTQGVLKTSAVGSPINPFYTSSACFTES